VDLSTNTNRRKGEEPVSSPAGEKSNTVPRENGEGQKEIGPRTNLSPSMMQPVSPEPPRDKVEAATCKMNLDEPWLALKKREEQTSYLS